MKEEIKFAFPLTIPIMAGYLFLGASYGILGYTQGLPVWLVLLSSILIYAGSAQFASVPVFGALFNPISTALLTLMINARHIFYGITMLDKYQPVKQPMKSYIIFGLTDETFSLVAGIDVPKNLNQSAVYFWITLLNQSYWVLGTILGLTLGRLIPINTQGIEFVLTALFWTIFVEQWLSSNSHTPALIGLGAGFICLILFGSGSFMIPAMLLIIAIFLILYRKG
ncbi:AzlC family ABC transporter permease [Aerococcaceae bacterium DSM 111176]|nr:AzlC family ABC transporter permease [Aerococcaceae bacterium DSM 111176]